MKTPPAAQAAYTLLFNLLPARLRYRVLSAMLTGSMPAAALPAFSVSLQKAFASFASHHGVAIPPDEFQVSGPLSLTVHAPPPGSIPQNRRAYTDPMGPAARL